MSSERISAHTYKSIAIELGFQETELELLVPFSSYMGEVNGLRSELRAVLLLDRLPIVARVLKAGHDDDLNGHKDLWIHFRDSLHSPMPVQVKSSKSNLDKFLKWRSEHRERIIGIDCGQGQPEAKILESFLTQLMAFDGFI